MKKNNLNLIPFGLSEKEGKFLDVAEVARGKQCGCICPSCRTPLIARHGAVNEWHFAHASKATASATKKPCKFSFFVSVRLMARQILGENLELLLPEYKDTVSLGLTPFHGHIDARFSITGQRRITLSNIEIEQSFLGKPVDIIGHIGEFSFIIYFTHPGRQVPAEFYHPPDSHCGILAISLEKLPWLFLNAKKQGKSYLKILHYFLTNNLPSKHWVFHPRHAQRKEQALIKLRQQAEQIIEKRKRQREERARLNRINHPVPKKDFEHNRKEPLTPGRYNPQNESPRLKPVPVKPAPVKLEQVRPEIEKKPVFYTPPVRIKGIKVIEQSEVKKRQANFECVLCKSQWQGPETSDSVCPKCKTHLYRKMLGFVDE